MNKSVNIKLKKLHESANPPAYQTTHAAGMDVESIEDAIIAPGAVRAIGTGWAMAIPVGYEVQVRPRSGLALKNSVTVINAPGTVDSDFRGEIKVLLHNLSAEPFTVTKGMRIAQLVVNAVPTAEFDVVEELPATERGTGGFGSTGH